MNAYKSWPPSVHSRSATFIWPGLEHFNQLHNVLTRNSTISTHVHTLILHGTLYSSVHEWDSIRNILPLLTCLNRLYLIPPTVPIFLDKLLPRPVQLTHLAFLSEWDKPLYEFIRNQPTLEYLAIGGVSYETVPLVPSLPPIYLPKLRVLDCSQCFFNRLDVSTPLEHLCIGATDDSIDKGPTPIEVLRNLKSLNCPSFMFGDLSRYCERIQFLWLTVSVRILCKFSIFAHSNASLYPWMIRIRRSLTTSSRSRRETSNTFRSTLAYTLMRTVKRYSMAYQISSSSTSLPSASFAVPFRISMLL